MGKINRNRIVYFMLFFIILITNMIFIETLWKLIVSDLLLLGIYSLGVIYSSSNEKTEERK